MSSKRFLFVNPWNSLPSGDEGSSSTARAFVMRKVRNQKPWSTKTLKLVDRRRSGFGKQGARASDAATVQLGTDQLGREVAEALREPRNNDTGKCMLCDQPHRTRGAVSIPATAKGLCMMCQIGTGCAMSFVSRSISGMDPFNSFAVNLDTRTCVLLSYFKTVIAPQITPIAAILQPNVVQLQWLAPSFAHAAFMHAILCLTAVQLSMSRPNSPEYILLAIFHRVRAVVAIQQNLEDPLAALSDNNLAAVFNLLCVEENLLLPSFAHLAGTHLRPDETAMRSHMRGLRDMIGLRGGLGSMSNAKTLRSFLLRHSAVQGVASFETPYLLPNGLLGRLYNYPASSQFYIVASPLSSTCRRLGFDVELVDIIKSAECLNQDIEAWITSPVSYGWDALDLQDLFSIMIDSCVRWILGHESTANSVECIVCLCLLTYLALLCRNKQAVSPPLPIVLTTMRRHIHNSAAWNMLRSMRLDTWVAILSVLASEGQREFADLFFQVYLSSLASHDRVLRTFDDFRESLSAGIWKSEPMDRYAREVWVDTPAEWTGLEAHFRSATGRRKVRPPGKSNVSSVLNPYTNAHPSVIVSVEGSAYNL
ncbi:hypothetical protein VFPBJ_07425 [Purpureocillium lilacinum]|uniref:Uncharacterized protein n=1 Tax=Purpureocillium lilacinum TaxID=33203 RepID=A0A179GHY9_PURLI|nr:hypothetical protein VFPBJ_07425 [Purpureocillium lilacinum]